ncbi:cellulase family glycosylhydrolase [Rhizobacter sp. Root1221]|uniref:cellulase family glycosylhydrolase n=1 Tax=Rhizobacter sp. Root1221 TaxID=1736433 RepID=UPI000700DDC9|nr:cellulase family glycosylhydrolase [Rhizobacter sp. Root1221]KQW01361.1 hypothetical protein ASC87_15915 [Rhizobacter sp. Root1221]
MYTKKSPTRGSCSGHLVQLLMTFILALWVSAVHAEMKIVAGVLQEADGTPFVMRGVNVAHAWYRDKTAQSLTDISARGANTARIVLANGVKWTQTDEREVKTLIEQCKAAKLIAVLEVHDTTGYGEQAGMATLDQAANYWVGIKNALIGQEDYVIVNLGNEPVGNGQPSSVWIEGHKNAIAKLRAAGIRNTLMVDAPSWGQDWEGVMRTHAASVFAADPLRNTVFSVHMYAVYPTDSEVNSYLSTFISAKLPLVVGEFGDTFQGQAVAASAIMSRARQYGIGYLGWSWSGNSGADTALDLAINFNGNSLSTWGQLLFNDTNGIAATAQRATIFGGSTTTPAACTLTLDTSGDWGTSQVLRLTIANTGTAPINGWTVSFNESHDFSIQSSWSATFAQSGRSVTVTPAEWTRTIQAGSSVEAGMQISYAGGRPVPGNVVVGGAPCGVVIR